MDISVVWSAKSLICPLTADGYNSRNEVILRTWSSGWNTVPLRDSLEKSVCGWDLDLLRVFLAKAVGARLFCEVLAAETPFSCPSPEPEPSVSAALS